MSLSATAYCRFCATSTPPNKLIDLLKDKLIFKDILNQLNRLNCNLDLKINNLHTAVCSACVCSLNLAFRFVVQFEQAQAKLNALITLQPIKQEAEDSVYQQIDDVKSPLVTEEHIDDRSGLSENNEIHIKLEQDMEGTTSIKTENNSEPKLADDNSDTDKLNIELMKPSPSANEDVAKESGDYNEVKIKLEIEDANPATSNNKDVAEDKLANDRQVAENKADGSESSPIVNSSIKSETNTNINDTNDRSVSEQKSAWREYKWTCVYCETQFPAIAELIKHSMEFHKCCNAYRCTECKSKKLTNLKGFLRHICAHRPDLRNSCHICFMVYPKRSIQISHKSDHDTSKYMCDGCHTSFPSPEMCNEHTKSFKRKGYNRYNSEQIPKDSLSCSVCKKTYKTEYSLHTHTLTHTERKREHICEVCGKSFLKKHNLNEHSMIHNDKRPFECEICKSSFRTRSILRNHIGTHGGDKPHACKQCGKCFRLRKHLNTHIATHSDTLPFVCSTCNKGFRFRSVLNAHLRQHTGVKPFTCSECEREFTNWSNYNKHMISKHNINMAKRKLTSHGTFSIDPNTGEVIYPDMDKVLEWQKKTQEGRATPRANHKVKKNKEDKAVKSKENS